MIARFLSDLFGKLKINKMREWWLYNYMYKLAIDDLQIKIPLVSVVILSVSVGGLKLLNFMDI